MGAPDLLPRPTDPLFGRNNFTSSIYLLVHPSDSESWRALDDFDADFVREARNVHIGLVRYGFMPYDTSVASYSCWSVFALSYNLPPSLCIKYEYMYLCFIIPSLDHPRTCLNVMLKLLFEELIMTRRKNSISKLCICGWSMILERTIFFSMKMQWNFDLSNMFEGHNLFPP
jgi:hypothetical protein